jgi:hypothetical protein
VTKSTPNGQYARLNSDKLVDDDVILDKYEKIKANPQELLFMAWDLPDFEHHHSRIDEIEVRFSSGQGISPIRVKDSNGDAFTTAKISGTEYYTMGVFNMDMWGKPCTFHFMHDLTHRPFVVVAGKQLDKIWLDLVLNFETDEPNLELIQKSYNYGKERADMLHKKYDRISKLLTDDVAILIEAQCHKPRKVDNLPFCLLNIHIVDKVAPVVPPIRRYTFDVSFPSVCVDGFSLLEAYPNSCWVAKGNDSMTLALSDGCILATLCFRDKQEQKRFTVTFGFCDKAIWSHVRFLMDKESKETTKNICNLKYDDWKHSTLKGCSKASILSAFDTLKIQEPWRTFPWVRQTPYDVVLEVSVHSHLLSKVRNQYRSKIILDHSIV